MDSVELSSELSERLESLRTRLQANAGPYVTVTQQNVFAYLLDLAAEIDEPDPSSTSVADQLSTVAPSQSFPRETLREQLQDRRLKHNNPETQEVMDLYTIAVEFDIEGRSSMKKAELIDAVLAVAEQQYTNPFESVDIEFPPTDSATNREQPAEPTDNSTPVVESTHNSRKANAESTTDDVDTDSTPPEADASDSGGSQLNTMLSLLETHDDKWHSTDGDARYEVELPDGSVESARTKDDVRALLFRNYK